MKNKIIMIVKTYGLKSFHLFIKIVTINTVKNNNNSNEMKTIKLFESGKNTDPIHKNK